MHGHGGATASVWMNTVELPNVSDLTQDCSTQVCVVGAGIAGLSAAYLLARAGFGVTVIDDGPIGGGETERTTAHLVTAADDRYFDLEHWHGAETARLAADSYAAAIARIESIITYERIDCEFERVPGYLILPPDGNHDLVDRELDAARRAGVVGVERLPAAPLPDFDTGPCLLFPQQGQFHPMKYLAGLARAIGRMGGDLHSNAHAVRIKGGDRAHVETAAGPVIHAQHIVVATNTPVNDVLAIHTKQAAYRTYAIAASIAPGTIPKALYWDGYWDADVPYHYVRLYRDAEGHELLIVGGEDHKTGHGGDDAELRYERLEEWARRRFGPIHAIVKQWSGQVMEPFDGLAFIGRNPGDAENVYIATGDSGTGMTHGTIAGILLTDLILGRANRWTNIYNPLRTTMRTAGTQVRDNAANFARYREWLSGGEVRGVGAIAPGTGAVIRHGVEKLAIYRDPQGQVHSRSAICPHLGCVVHWNSAEQSWDCPCHGSRFDALGQVLNGPAIINLAPAGDVPSRSASPREGPHVDGARAHDAGERGEERSDHDRTAPRRSESRSQS